MNVLPANISISSARLPQTYEHAKQALTACNNIDECQQWADKAEALASYAKQADDDTLRRLADRIQARAVRRAGELLKQLDGRGDHMKKGGTSLSRTDAANRAGMSDDQRKTAVRVANVPDDEFESAVEGDNPPTVTALAERGKQSRPAPEGFKEATHLLGAVKRFAEFCSTNAPETVAGGVMPSEVGGVRKQVAAIDSWLDRFVVNLKG
jgi:beta-phosphoglucomutase-like phosphatase (HAD superfamily)